MATKNALKDALKKEPATFTSTPKAEATVTKRKPGRPKVKTEAVKVINVAVPVSLYEKMLIASDTYRGNLTAYVNDIVSQDIDSHFEEYKKVSSMLKG